MKSSDLIRRQEAIEICNDAVNFWDGTSGVTGILSVRDEIAKLDSAQPEHLVMKSGNLVKGLVNDCISRQAAIAAIKEWGLLDGLSEGQAIEILADEEKVPSAQPEIIHCCDCIYYDPEHIEKNGVRYEYRDMPKDAFDSLGTGMVNSEYGINVGGRCCRDFNFGYSEDKRVFVSEQNYCGRAERRQDD